MIPRYTRPEMSRIWTDENKFAIWLRVEVLACEALHRLGDIPAEDLKRIQKRAKFDVKRIDEIEREVNHDVIAFLTCVAEYVGPSARYIRHGSRRAMPHHENQYTRQYGHPSPPRAVHTPPHVCAPCTDKRYP